MAMSQMWTFATNGSEGPGTGPVPTPDAAGAGEAPEGVPAGLVEVIPRPAPPAPPDPPTHQHVGANPPAPFNRFSHARTLAEPGPSRPMLRCYISGEELLDGRSRLARITRADGDP